MNVSMIFNSQIFNAVIEAAKAKAAGSPAWLRAIDRAATELHKAPYWSFDSTTNTLTLISKTSGKKYTIDGNHTCDATANGHTACKHRAAHRLMLRYVEALANAPAATTHAAEVATTPTPASIPAGVGREKRVILMGVQPSDARPVAKFRSNALGETYNGWQI